jgi:CheY-like chemotaxis protein/GGDEF domain-containing protein
MMGGRGKALASKARILAIDDQLYFRSLIEGLLSEEGYSVRTAGGDADALALIEREGPFDLVVMDLVMPETNGVELVATLRERHPGQEVIVLTGIGDVRSVVSAMKRGAADYLLKPIDRESLLQSIASVLENRKLRAEHARLLGENLEFMGRLSLFERALPLLGLKRPIDVGKALLELVGTESKARDGILWMRQTETGPLLRGAARGEADLESAAEEWIPGSEDVPDTFETGCPVVVDGPEPTLWVPCIRDTVLLAVVRLRAPTGGAFAAGTEKACEKLSEIGALAIANAFEVCALQQTSFKDPITGLPTRPFLEMVAQTEIHKAHRYGRRLLCLCLELETALNAENGPALEAVVNALLRTQRTTDVIAAEDTRRFWVLVTDADPLGSVVLKRRLAEKVGEALEGSGVPSGVAVGAGSYPADGERVEDLIQAASEGVRREQASVVNTLGIEARTTLAEITDRLLAQATPMPATFVSEAADLVIGELSCRPQDRGLLFLAPGSGRSSFFGPLTALGDAKTSTEVFLATDGDTIPSGPAVTALPLPSEVCPDATWIVRFGEAPSYALVAGPELSDGVRPVYHSGDPVLVEHLTFRLRSEVGFGVRT